MKLSITDKFLLELYGFLKEGGSFISSAVGPRRSILKILPQNYNLLAGKYRKRYGRDNFSKLVHYLKRKNYIQAENLKSSNAIFITKKGLDKALKASFTDDVLGKRKDGKHILLMFDIPQNHKKARILMRSILRNLGYVMFQQSVWISEYDVLEKTGKLLQFYSLDEYVKILLTEEV